MISYLTGPQLRLFSICLSCFVSSWSAVQAQDDYCSYSQALAITLLNQNVDSCSLDLSACNNPVCVDCLPGADSAATSCADGCSYTYGDYTVERIFSGSYGTAYVGVVAVPIIFAGTSHTFTAGAEGSGQLIYEAGFNDDATILLPALGGSCQFNFNDNACFCEQRYCDASQTTANFYVDCSGFEGGSVINFCDAIGDFTESSSLLEILVGVPFAACRAPSETESFPTTTPGSGSAAGADTFAPKTATSATTAIPPTSSPAQSDSAAVPATPVVASTTEPATGTAPTPPPLTVEGTNVAPPPPPPAPVAPKPGTNLSSASVQAQALCSLLSLWILSIVLSQMMN